MLRYIYNSCCRVIPCGTHSRLFERCLWQIVPLSGRRSQDHSQRARRSPVPHPSGPIARSYSPGDILGAALAPNSRVTYARAVKVYHDYVGNHYPTYNAFPAHVMLLFHFITHLLNSGRAPASISTIMSSLSHIHKLG
jgi:hypothetical protein